MTKLVLRLSTTYANIRDPLNANFDSIEYQFNETLESVDRATLLAVVLESIINEMETFDFAQVVRDRLGQNVSSSFITALLMDISSSMVFRMFVREVKGSSLDFSDNPPYIKVIKFGPGFSVLEQ